jgi:FkbM family methyltransferase
MNHELASIARMVVTIWAFESELPVPKKEQVVRRSNSVPLFSTIRLMPNSLASRIPGATRVRRSLHTLERIANVSGTHAVVSWLWMRLKFRFGVPMPERWRIRPKAVKYPLTARLGQSSDMNVYVQIFDEDEYACLRDLKNVKTVMDLGANVGFSSAYFLNCFPDSKLLAVEADGRNFEICRENLAPYGDRAKVIHGAAWYRQELLSLSRGTFGDGREWATQVVARSKGSEDDIQGWDVPSLMQLAGFSEIDLLKIDIEGSEKYLFGGADFWLQSVHNICIELHGPDCERAFQKALSGYDYELSHSGELTICRNIRKK